MSRASDFSGGDSNEESESPDTDQTPTKTKKKLVRKSKIEGPAAMSLDESIVDKTQQYDETGAESKVNNFEDVCVSIEMYEGPNLRRNIRFLISHQMCSWLFILEKMEMDRVCRSLTTPDEITLIVSGKAKIFSLYLNFRVITLHLAPRKRYQPDAPVHLMYIGSHGWEMLTETYPFYLNWLDEENKFLHLLAGTRCMFHTQLLTNNNHSFSVISPKMLMERKGDMTDEWPKMPPADHQIHCPVGNAFLESIRGLSTLEAVWDNPQQEHMLRQIVVRTGTFITRLNFFRCWNIFR
jgi:hypothetical protein